MSTRAPETYTLDEAIAEIHRLRAEVERLDGELQQARSSVRATPEVEAGPPELRALEGFAELIAAARTPGPRRESARTVPFISPGRRIAGEALEVFPPAATTAAGRLTQSPSARQAVEARDARFSPRDAAARTKDITFDTPVDSRNSPFGSPGSGATVRNDAGSRLAASGEEAVNRHLAEMRATINRIRENLRLGPSRYPALQEGSTSDAAAAAAPEAPVQEAPVQEAPAKPAPSSQATSQALQPRAYLGPADSAASGTLVSAEPVAESRVEPESRDTAPPSTIAAPQTEVERVALEKPVESPVLAPPRDEKSTKGRLKEERATRESAAEPIAYVSNQPIAWPPTEALEPPVPASPAPMPDAVEAPEAKASRGKAVAGIAAVLALAAVAAWYWARPAQPVGQTSPPTTSAPPAQDSLQATTPAEPAAAVPASAPPDTATSPAPAETALAPAAPSSAPSSGPAGPGQLQLTTSREVWLFVVVDGRTVLESLAPAGRTFSFTMTRDASVRVGDAGAVLASIGGAPPNPLGSDGSVLTRRFAVAGAPAAGGDTAPQSPQ